MARKNETGELIEDTRSEEEKAFDSATKQVAARARDINKSVKDWRSGDSELEDLILEVQLAQRKLQKALVTMAAAHKTLATK